MEAFKEKFFSYIFKMHEKTFSHMAQFKKRTRTVLSFILRSRRARWFGKVVREIARQSAREIAFRRSELLSFPARFLCGARLRPAPLLHVALHFVALLSSFLSHAASLAVLRFLITYVYGTEPQHSVVAVHHFVPRVLMYTKH